MINANEQQYLDLLKHVLENGTKREDRTGTGTIGIFGAQLRFDLSENFPVLTTKKMFLKGIFHELIWFLRGDTNIKYLKDNGVNIWNEWADKNGDLGPVYGKQWRAWEDSSGLNVDQISEVIQQIKKNPYSRRHIVTAWNPCEIEDMALPPCHCLFQFHVTPPKTPGAKGILNCQLYQRSADLFLGVPFNIASYALLVHMVAHVCNLHEGEFIHTFGDAHIYLNHVDQVKEQLSRKPKRGPKLICSSPWITDIFKFEFDDFYLRGYESHPAIKAEISV